MQIEDVALDQLSLDPLNARKHDRRNLDAIKASVLRFGIQKPIIALNSGTIIAGNGFFMVAKGLGFKTVPVKRFEKPEDARAYAIADKTARGVYKGGMHGKRMAAEAIRDSRKPVPESLVPFLTKTNPMEDAA